MANHKRRDTKAGDLRDKIQSTLYLLNIGGAELSTLLSLLDSSSIKDESVLVAASSVSYNEVAVRTSKAVGTVRAAIRTLIAKGYISCHARPGDSNITLVLLEPIAAAIQKRADDCEMFWVDFRA